MMEINNKYSGNTEKAYLNKGRPYFRVMILLAFVISQGAIFANTDSWDNYKGAWFSIDYPAGFSALASIKSTTGERNYDSVFFESKDRKVSFYVFSPQWSGDPVDIIAKSNENIIGEQVTENNGVSFTYTTLSDKSGSYFRSFVDRKDNRLNTRLVFGIKYTNKNAYEEYKERYVLFKKSLQQYSD